jgi:hypothetical protein
MANFALRSGIAEAAAISAPKLIYIIAEQRTVAPLFLQYYCWAHVN